MSQPFTLSIVGLSALDHDDGLAVQVRYKDGSQQVLSAAEVDVDDDAGVPLRSPPKLIRLIAAKSTEIVERLEPDEPDELDEANSAVYWPQEDEHAIRLQLDVEGHCFWLRSREPQEIRRYLFNEHKVLAECIWFRSPFQDQEKFKLSEEEQLLPASDGLRLTYGQIIGLAGDHVPFFDKTAASANGILNSWPKGFPANRNNPPRWLCLEDLTQKEADSIANHNPDMPRPSLHALRFIVWLARNNYCHFAIQPNEEEASKKLDLDIYKSNPLYVYLYYHGRALCKAAAGHLAKDRKTLFKALALDAFGAHFLTDLFASGHMRVPRRHLVATSPPLVGHFRSGRMHNHENKRGLWVTTLVPQADGPWHWRAFGDGHLEDQTGEAKMHRSIVVESVRRSAQEVIRMWEQGESARLRHPELEQVGKEQNIADYIDMNSAEALIPVPLAPEVKPPSSCKAGGSSFEPNDFTPNPPPPFVAKKIIDKT